MRLNGPFRCGRTGDPEVSPSSPWFVWDVTGRPVAQINSQAVATDLRDDLNDAWDAAQAQAAPRAHGAAR